MTINWDVGPDDHTLIVAIAERATELHRLQRRPAPKLHELVMDLTAVHANGCPLRLDELLEAPDGDFMHDVTGIRRHIDRDTGKLTDCFLPRYSVEGSR